ncbi:hypothetical protein P170DRAFT_454881 [Aspergillus steynii IBT 23096]|uniref:Aminoglycoside phosphotransferase domain-containing protein n=1 Tax=Aspergillus steynii IBT 23096 TaxID=1392250 RepID=A0A2I2GBV8_9EURO|nr:uncharacterized protein P170DRAFT_454881 [Aspergillus steynii IBT 23096]PLB50327.1 hypothetical protein P170DRAFT_454881 [Aspergillus steynii IBT 23096]
MAAANDPSSVTLKSRHLVNGSITYSAAQECERNVLHELGYWDQETNYLSYLYQNRDSIRSIVARHLGLNSPDKCHIAEPEQWMRGSFNICIPVDADGQGPKPGIQMIIRFPLPYRVGEVPCPGNADEKIFCEAGTYVWLQANCPDVAIPHLYGFGLATGRTVLRRGVLAWLGYEVPSRFVQICNKAPAPLNTGYILIEYIGRSRGKMLSESWEEGRHSPQLRMNLFRGLSRTLLSLTRTPLPRIGSFVLDDKGYLRLNNRPLTLQIPQLENERIPVDIPREVTHISVDSYINDIISLHESRLRHQPNAVCHLEDGFYQTSALMVMRSIWSCYFRRDFLRGPFFLTLTDIHQSNIFVDDEWNIKCFIDLEWACSRPVEMIHPPYWLTNQAIDSITLEDYESLHAEFMTALAEEESKCLTRSSLLLHPILQQGWEKGTFWCSLALNSPTALFRIFYDYIQPRFSKAHNDDSTFWVITMPYWTFNSFDFIEQKVKDKKQYDVSLREAFKS